MSECMEKNKEYLCDSNTEIKTFPSHPPSKEILSRVNVSGAHWKEP